METVQKIQFPISAYKVRHLFDWMPYADFFRISSFYCCCWWYKMLALTLNSLSEEEKRTLKCLRINKNSISIAAMFMKLWDLAYWRHPWHKIYFWKKSINRITYGLSLSENFQAEFAYCQELSRICFLNVDSFLNSSTKCVYVCLPFVFMCSKVCDNHIKIES